jgi:hypoxanthine phosphoribosyltransferase
MKRIRLYDKEFELFISEKEIVKAISAIALQIKRDMEGKNPLLVGVLNGSFMFVAELMRQLNDSYELAFVRYASYKGTSTTGDVQEIMPLSTNVSGRTVILLEDIIDSGFTMQCVKNKLKNEGAVEVRLATMLFKPTALKCDLQPDYVGIEIPDRFVVGYGLDYNELGRTYRDIYTIID